MKRASTSRAQDERRRGGGASVGAGAESAARTYQQLLEGPRMSSESNGHKPPESGPPPPQPGGGVRPSARAPSAWGAARDALAAVHNLEALLRSASVPHRTILDLIPELRTSAGVLRDAFERACGADEASARVGAYGNERVEELGRLLDETASTEQGRDELASRVHVLADELEASADLLALLERAAAPVPTDVSINLIVRETARMAGTGRGRELVVHFDEASPDCVVTTDPYVVGPLLSLAVARAHRAGIGDIAVRARCMPPNATLLIERAGQSDGSLPAIAMRVLPDVPPAEQAARRVAEQIGALLLVEPARWAIALAPATG